MAKLTDTQLVVQSKAAARDDGLAVVPAKMNNGATSNVGSSLVARKLVRELKAKPGMPVWHEDEDGRGISLMITRARRDAIGIDDETEAAAARQFPRSGSPAGSMRLIEPSVGAARASSGPLQRRVEIRRR